MQKGISLAGEFSIIERLSGLLRKEASYGRPSAQSPNDKRRAMFERWSSEILEGYRSSFAGCQVHLVSFASLHAVVVETTAGDCYRLGEKGWVRVNSDEVRKPHWREGWWFPAHSPATAVLVLAETLKLWRRLDNFRRRELELKPRKPGRDFYDSVLPEEILDGIGNDWHYVL